MHPFNPYAGNILIDGLGPILSRREVMERLLFLPPIPGDPAAIPIPVRLHLLMQLRDLHVPTLEEARLYETIDLMVRPAYSHRNPANPATWRVISNEARSHKTPRAPGAAAAVVGISGTGKTEAILRDLACFPQYVVHESFPNVVGQFVQLVYLSIDAPPSGRAKDLAINLRTAFDNIMSVADPGAPLRFADEAKIDRRHAGHLLEEWRQVAVSHFLGALHIDEVQNFFRLQSLEVRRKRRNSNEGYELSIVEDQCLKTILTFTNTWGIPLILSGTPDGIGALTKRLSNTQRFVTSGYHHFPYFPSADDPVYKDNVFPVLWQYQYVAKPIDETKRHELAHLVIELTGGILRVMIALWITAHRVAFERGNDALTLEDFKTAARTYLSPIAPAIDALRSNSPEKFARYEDLIRRDDNFWASFWTNLSGNAGTVH